MVSQSPLIGAPLGPTMLRLGIPGVIGALLTSLPGLVEATFLKSAGSEALDTLALPIFGSFIRLAIVVSGLLWITPETGISAALGLVAVAAACYGIIVGVGLKLGPWRTESGKI